VKELRKIQEEAKAALHKARDDMKRFADRTRAHAPEYKEGDKCGLVPKILILTDHHQAYGTILLRVNPSVAVRATPSNIPKWASCGLYKNSGSGEMRLIG